MTIDNEEDGVSLVMPFIICQSRGGKYDDDSFSAGFAAGDVWRALAGIRALGGPIYTTMTRADLTDQLDLIAMHYGFLHTQVTETEVSDWVMWTCSAVAMEVETE